MPANIIIDDSDFKNALSRYLREYPREVSESLRIRARILFTRIAKHLPPDNKPQGQNRVRADIRKAENPLNPDSFKNPQVKKVIRAGKIDAVRDIVENSSKLANQRVEPFSSAFHISARDSGTGRVKYPKNLLVLGYTKWKQYVKIRQKQVGLLRASFAIPVNHFGAVISGGKWYDGSRADGSGAVRDETANETNPSFTFTCFLKYASRYESYIRASLDADAKAMTRDLEGALKRAGEKTHF